ncbi:chemotaxis protein CheC [Pontibacillus marinus]|uniref:Chemotaxis protein CheY n=1 Tax=Pontibacillus marinus BH030004 = DSM 16465 TaxID=1385511 RepID=A0A0A5G666_9BACI|nr:chemotaxis protein CheC [Pontibacillus marinus]KGX88616.1 chemotaxis protein CheY [Pontibacillus marinus BH030004 = DSM 16465]
MPFMNQFSQDHLDVLKEVGNIGAGHAATSLSKLLDRKIDMNIPDVRLVSFNEMMDIAGGAEQVLVSVFLRLEGDVSGSMFFVLPPEQANRMAFQMTGDEKINFSSPPYSEMGVSAINELGNILSGSYLSALSDFTNLSIQPSVPSVSIDMIGAVLSFGLLELSQVSDHAIVIDTCIKDNSINSGEVRGHFFLLPDPGSFPIIFKALGVQDHE